MVIFEAEILEVVNSAVSYTMSIWPETFQNLHENVSVSDPYLIWIQNFEHIRYVPDLHNNKGCQMVCSLSTTGPRVLSTLYTSRKPDRV